MKRILEEKSKAWLRLQFYTKADCTLAHCKNDRTVLFYCALHILCFLHIEGLWQACVDQVYLCHFSNRISSLRISMSHVGNSPNFKLFHYYHICFGDLWSVIFDVTIVNVLGYHKQCPRKMANFIYKCCLYSVCFTEQPFPCLSPFPQGSLFSETKQKWN